MSDYNREQAEALALVRRFVGELAPEGDRGLRACLAAYLAFRGEVDRFFAANVAGFCDRKCFRTRLSACCSKEGIVTFFGDVVVNVLVSPAGELERLEAALASPPGGRACVYLGPRGCLWRVTPIVCAMFLCDAAKKDAFSRDPSAQDRWADLVRRRKIFTWPDRPVLFDDLEQAAIDAGHHSPLMYLHSSPGMLRVKRQAGICPTP